MTLCNTPLPDGSSCRGLLTRSKSGPWIELECPSCGYFASRHQDSTDPVQETGEDQERETRKWWD